jgi:hypothetical protein
MALIAIASLAGMTLALVLAATAWSERDNARQQQALAEGASRDAQRRQAQAEGMLGFLLDDLRPKLIKVGQLDLLDAVDKKRNYFAGLMQAASTITIDAAGADPYRHRQREAERSLFRGTRELQLPMPQRLVTGIPATAHGCSIEARRNIGSDSCTGKAATWIRRRPG